VSDDLTPVAFVPTTRASTSKVRRMLPETVPHADAAFGAGRAALLVQAMRDRPDLLLAATADRLHQPYRAPAMPRSAKLADKLRAADIPAVISGAGPTVLALVRGDDADAVVNLAGPTWEVHRLTVDRDGARTVPLEV
jgi:homoserine kinase